MSETFSLTSHITRSSHLKKKHVQIKKTHMKEWVKEKLLNYITKCIYRYIDKLWRDTSIYSVLMLSIILYH